MLFLSENTFLVCFKHPICFVATYSFKFMAQNLFFIPTNARLTHFCYWFHSNSKVESSFLLKFNLQIQANLFLISTALGLEQKGNITSSATSFLSMYTREGTAYIIKKKKHVSIYTPRFSPKILFRQNHCKHLNCKRSC